MSNHLTHDSGGLVRSLTVLVERGAFAGDKAETESVKRLGWTTPDRLNHLSCLVVICAYNEAPNLPQLLKKVAAYDVLVIDDGSLDGTAAAALAAGVNLVRHPKRLGKKEALKDGVRFAIQHGYSVVLDLGADTVPDDESIEKLIAPLERSDIGGASGRQIPMQAGSRLAYLVDDVIWAVLSNGKEYQMRRDGDAYLGAVMFTFKLDLMQIGEGTNDDEAVWSYLRSQGLKTVYVKDAVVYFDASSSLHAILDRRIRMNFGHLVLKDSGAPSAVFAIAVMSLFATLNESKRRLPWILPAMAIEVLAKFWAWKDFRTGKFSKYALWVTLNKTKNPLAVDYTDHG
jgi:glycosyltransferase involved in cell wall biosynthesis